MFTEKNHIKEIVILTLKILTDIFISKSKNANSFKKREKNLILKSFINKSALIFNEVSLPENAQIVYETLENEFYENFVKGQEFKFKLDLKEPFLYIPISIGHLFEEYPYNVQNTAIEDNFKFDIKIFLYLLQFKNILQGNLKLAFPIPNAYLELRDQKTVSTEREDLAYFSIKNNVKKGKKSSLILGFCGNAMIKGELDLKNQIINVSKIYPLRICFFTLEKVKVGLFKTRKCLTFTDLTDKSNPKKEQYFDEDQNILDMAIKTFQRYKENLQNYERESVLNYFNALTIECTKMK